MTTSINIERKRGDTRRIVFVIKDADGAVEPITNWTQFLLTISPTKEPVDGTTKIDQMVGVILDGPSGRVAFLPTGLIDVGKYYYDAQGVDDDGGKITFVQGRYTLKQDITKD